MKKLLAVLMCLTMVFAMAPSMVFAGSNQAAIGDTEYATINAAIEAAKSGDTVKILNDFTTDERIVVTDKVITIDLNGHTVKSGIADSFVYVHGGSGGILTITDNSSGGGGKIIAKGDNIIRIDGGTVQVIGGTVSSEGCWTYDGKKYGNSIVLLKGEKDKEAEGYSRFVLGENGKLASIRTDGADSVGAGYVMVGHNDKCAYGVVMDIQGEIDNAVLYVNGQIAQTEGNVPVINVTDSAKVDGGIYAAGYAKWNITGGIITGSTGIEIRAGELNVSGNPVITGTGVPTSVSANGNGSTSDGCGIAIAQHTTKLPITVNILGGTIKGYSALYESNPQNNEFEDLAKVKISVSDGDLEAIKGGTVVVYSEDKKEFITGGTFSSDIAPYIDKEKVGIQVIVEGAENATTEAVRKFRVIAKDEAVAEGSKYKVVVGGITYYFTNKEVAKEFVGDIAGNYQVPPDIEEIVADNPTEQQTPAKADGVVDTGDDFNLFALGGVALAAILAMLAVVLTGRRQRQR